MTTKSKEKAFAAISQNTFEIDIELYYWLVDTSDMPDDHRNQIDQQNKSVRLYREHSQKLLNGVYVGKLMLAMKRIALRSKKTFTIDPNLGNLKDQNIPKTRQYNWQVIFSEIGKFKIKISNEQKRAISADQSHSQLCEFLERLRKEEENLQAEAKGGRRDSSPNKLDEKATSEINFERSVEPLERSFKKNSIIQKADSHVGLNDDYQVYAQLTDQKLKQNPSASQFINSIDYQTPAKLKNSKTSKSLIKLEQTDLDVPFDQLINDPRASIDTTNQASLEGTDEDAFEQYFQSETKIDPKTQQLVQDSTTAAQMMLGSMMMSFALNEDQVAALLKDNNKLLIQLCIQGQKTIKYQQIVQWYFLIYNNIGRLITVLLKEENYVPVNQTLDILRCGLYSRSPDVAILCCRCFAKMSIVINDNPQNQKMAQLAHWYWDWLTLKKKIGAKKTTKTTKNERELNKFLQEEGMKAFLSAHDRHGQVFDEQFSAFLIQVGANNYIDLFMTSLRESTGTPSAFLNLIHDIHQPFTSSSLGKAAFQDSGLMLMIIDMCLQITSEPIDSGLQTIDAFQVETRQSALACLVDFWKVHPERFGKRGNDQERKAAENIMIVLKRACREKFKSISIQAVNLQYDLLDKFALERNEYAPTIYKAMTFLLMDQYYKMDVRQEVIHSFISLFNKHKAIPIAIMCTPYFKQLNLDLARLGPTIRNENLGQLLATDQIQLNMQDFELLYVIASHPKFTPSLACQLITIISEVSTKSLIFTRVSLNLLMQILANFENNTQIYEHIQQTIRDIYKSINEQDQIKLELYVDTLKHNPKAKLRLKKRSHALLLSAKKNQVAASLEAGFSAGVNKNTQNAKYQGEYYSDNTGELIENQDLKSAVSVSSNQNLKARIDQILLREKQIVNLVAVFVNSGIKVLRDFILENAIANYIRTAEAQTVHNAGLVYIMRLFQSDWQLLVSTTQKQIRIERRKNDNLLKSIKAQSQIAQSEANLTLDRSILDSVNVTPQKLPPIKSRELPSIGRPPQILDRQNSTKKYGQSNSVKRSFDNYNTRTEQSPYVSSEFTGKSDRVGRKKSLNLLQSSYDNPGTLPRGLLPKARGITIERVKYYDIQEEVNQGNIDESEIEDSFEFILSQKRILQAMFTKYSNISNNKKTSLSKVTFDDLKNEAQYMNLSEIFAFLNDFSLLAAIPSLKRDDYKRLIRLCNLKDEESTSGTKAELQFSTFIDFIVQLAYHFNNTDIRRPTIFFPKFWDFLKQTSLASQKVLFQRLFQDPSSQTIGDPVLIEELTRRVNADPNYKLPPGFIKTNTVAIQKVYRAPNYVNESQKIALEVLDGIFTKAGLGHILHQELEKAPKVQVKVDVYNVKNKRNLKSQYNKPQEFDDNLSYSGSIGSYNTLAEGSINNDYSTKPSTFKKNSLAPVPVNMTKNLKLELLNLQQSDPDNADQQVECALVLNELIFAADRGLKVATPRTKGRILNPNSRVPLPGIKVPPRNRIQSLRRAQEESQETERRRKDKAYADRKVQLKKDLQIQNERRVRKKSLEQAAAIHKTQTEEEQKRRKEKSNRDFYDSFRRDYVQNRLPAIEEEDKLKNDQELLDKRRQREAKLEAEVKIKAQTEGRIKQFNDDTKARQDFINKKTRTEKRQKQDHDDYNAQLVKGRKASVPKSNTKNFQSVRVESNKAQNLELKPTYRIPTKNGTAARVEAPNNTIQTQSQPPAQQQAAPAQQATEPPKKDVKQEAQKQWTSIFGF